MVSRSRGLVAGVVAALAALAVGELLPALFGVDASLVSAVGSEFIDRFAAALKDLAVALFGTNDKVALVSGVVVVSLALGAGLGVVARRRHEVLWLGFAAFGLVGAAALATDPRGGVAVGVVSGVGAVLAGVGVYETLTRLGRPPATDAADAASSPVGRRTFVLGAGSFVVAAAIAVGAARSVTSARVAAIARPTGPLPVAQRRIAVPGATFTDPGISPFVTPTSDFYRIDTALTIPRVDPSDWRLAIGGMVDRPFTVTYDELLAMDGVEAPVTIQCVSNQVGGNLVGTAVWQGVPLADLLERAGVRPDATQVVGRSVDGWTAGFPTADALDGRTALVAYAMNGEPLPFRHGFPARLVVSGLYGYVSATKWLREIELTTWEAFDGYWVPRGWSKDGPIKLTSRIDVPASGAALVAGPVVVAGVAWSPNVGVAAVEVQVDDGPWEQAELGPVASTDTWVQWRLPWTATSGDHVVRVRATDADGSRQTPEMTDPAPDGATGWHTRTVRVA